MAQHIGIVACSAEGAALCYKTICAAARDVMGEHAHPEITMHTHPLADYMLGIRSGDWAAVAELMLSSARKVASVGADFAVCPDNTIHQAFDLAVERSPIPWLHIARVVAAEAAGRGYARIGILGTRYLIEGPVYPDALALYGIGFERPGPADRKRVDGIIFDELVYGVTTDESRAYVNDLIGRLATEGADAVVLGCTELPLLVRPEESPLPTLDSTRLLARAALARALE
jgi:aspartate racemase